MQVTERQSKSANSLFKTCARVWTVNQPSAQCIDDPDGVMLPVHCAAFVQHYRLFIFGQKKSYDGDCNGDFRKGWWWEEKMDGAGRDRRRTVHCKMLQ